MKIIPPSFALEPIDGQALLRRVEAAGRVCYKSEARVTDDSAGRFVRMLLKSGHESVLEHEKITARIICDRGVSHEIVRHRIASYSQESTRYCNYGAEKFGGGLTFIRPCFWDEGSEMFALWAAQMAKAEECYLALLAAGATPEEARAVLPNSLKTELVMTMDLREWRHFFRLRAAAPAHPQMRELAVPMLRAFAALLPEVFGDLLCE
ncbi:MAG: FAD-dependent thymidylate synthase [Oscillospiraceae bacterium]|jgi:thymidylate synthase (FAD)|nr:FAD-dependent thymidylate synthase [Oscillospiraceae bacterium]